MGSGSIAGPLIEDALLARVSVSHRDSDGTIINQVDGNGIDRNRQTRITGRLIAMPAPGLELDFRAAYTDETGGATWFSRFDVLGQTGGQITEDVAGVFPAQDTPSLSERQIVDLSPGGESRFIDAVGQSGHFLSRHYDDFLDDWRTVSGRPMRMDRAEIEKGATGRLRLVPAAE